MFEIDGRQNPHVVGDGSCRIEGASEADFQKEVGNLFCQGNFDEESCPEIEKCGQGITGSLTCQQCGIEPTKTRQQLLKRDRLSAYADPFLKGDQVWRGQGRCFAAPD